MLVVLLVSKGIQMLAGTIIRKFAYRIEVRPEGGFIARPIDRSMETLEGATREEIQQKIEARLGEVLGVPLATFKISDIARIPDSRFKVTVTKAARTLTPTELESSRIPAPPPPIAPADGSGGFLKAIILAIVVLAFLYYFLHR